MSLATELTSIQGRLSSEGQRASEYLRAHKQVMPAEVYNELQLYLITVASEATKLKMTLGAMRMVGELDPQPPAVTAESLELSRRRQYAEQLRRIGDDTLTERENSMEDEPTLFARDHDQNVLVNGEAVSFGEGVDCA